MKLFQMFALGTVVATGLVMAQVPAAPTAAQKAKTTAKEVADANTATPAPTAAEIADAKSKGLVWVNLKSKVFHKSDNKYYGATKSGKFMTEADAQKAGYRAARDAAPKTNSTAKK